MIDHSMASQPINHSIEELYAVLLEASLDNAFVSDLNFFAGQI